MALRPLQHRSVEVAGLPPTGPIARGDAATVAAHLEAVGPELAPLYRALGRATLPLVSPAAAAAVRGRAVKVGLVPTMGALHDGHRALLRAARAECDRVVMSLFVNPTQFGPGEDLDRYPRDAAGDRAIAADEGVDEVYAPAVADMYPDGFAHRRLGRRARPPVRGRPPPRALRRRGDGRAEAVRARAARRRLLRPQGRPAARRRAADDGRPGRAGRDPGRRHRQGGRRAGRVVAQRLPVSAGAARGAVAAPRARRPRPLRCARASWTIWPWSTLRASTRSSPGRVRS